MYFRTEEDHEGVGEEVEQGYKDAPRGGTKEEAVVPSNSNLKVLASYEEPRKKILCHQTLT